MDSHKGINQRKQGAVLGALVADAASLGLHWLYDFERVSKVSGKEPEFITPNKQHYENVAGFFAHSMKTVGEQTHYGEQLAVCLRSLAQNRGEWKPFHYLESFCNTFGYGGRFHGYIDGSTLGTLTNYRRANERLMAGAQDAAPGIEKYPLMVINELFQTIGVTASGEALIRPILNAANEIFTDENVMEQIEAVVRYYENNRTYLLGADDNQVPCFSKLPPLVASYAGDTSLDRRVEEAVRITNNNSDAVNYGLFAARALEQVILGEDIPRALEIAAKKSNENVQEKINTALSFKYDSLEQLGQKFGTNCVVDKAFPVSSAILYKAPSYVSGVRDNILVGGDNAGRSIFVGAMLGASYGLDSSNGIPLSWLMKLKSLPDYLSLTTNALKMEN